MRARPAALLAGLLVAALTPLLPAAAPAVAGAAPADRIDLPRDFQPEGIAAKGQRLFSGSLAGGGVASARIGAARASVIREMPGSSLRGMAIDPRTGFLTMVGNTKNGRPSLWVIVPREGGVQATYARLPGAVFPNDLTFGKRAIWVTDSGQNVLYRVQRPPRNAFPPVPLPVETLALRGPIPPVVGDDIGLNGIRKLPGGRLVVVDSRDGALYEVRHSNGRARPVPVAGPVQLSSGDGLEIQGRTLYVVRGQGGNDVVRLRLRQLADGFVASRGRVLTDPSLSVPSTAVLRGGSLWLANARFGIDTERYYLTGLPLG